MNLLGQTITDTQRHAETLSTEVLRVAIRNSLDGLDEAIDQLNAITPGMANVEQVAHVAGDVIGAALMTALYVRELTLRPAPRFTRVYLSVN